MVYTQARRYIASGKRKYKRFNNWSKTPQTPRALALQAYQGVKYLKGLVNSEMLHKDQAVVLSGTRNTIAHLTAISQGDSDSGRTGNSLLLRNIYFRGALEIHPSVTGNTRISLVLVKDTQQVSDTTPNMSDIFQNYNDPDTMLNTNAFGRFKILWRKTYCLTPPAGGRNVIDFNKYWKIYDHVRFNGSATSDIQRNGYYLVILSSEVSNFPTCNINTRIGYHDN